MNPYKLTMTSTKTPSNHTHISCMATDYHSTCISGMLMYTCNTKLAGSPGHPSSQFCKSILVTKLVIFIKHKLSRIQASCSENKILAFEI